MRNQVQQEQLPNLGVLEHHHAEQLVKLFLSLSISGYETAELAVNPQMIGKGRKHSCTADGYTKRVSHSGQQFNMFTPVTNLHLQTSRYKMVSIYLTCIGQIARVNRGLLQGV